MKVYLHYLKFHVFISTTPGQEMFRFFIGTAYRKDFITDSVHQDIKFYCYWVSVGTSPTTALVVTEFRIDLLYKKHAVA
jgi:hypothetical protein